MKLTAPLAAALLALSAGTALAAHHHPATPTTPATIQALPPTYVIYKLTQDGLQLRALKATHGIYAAWFDAADGSWVKVGVDARTAELTDAFSRASAQANTQPAPAVDAAGAVQTVAATGYWDVREIALCQDSWRIKAGNDDGRVRQFQVDARTGRIE